jgi:hypothetical protein
LIKVVSQVGAIVLSLGPYLTRSKSVTDLPPNETIRGVHVDAHGEQEEQEVFETLIRLAQFGEADEDEDDKTSVFFKQSLTI